jgi:HTH-type transcriptional regulator/antitoxin HigA
MIKLIKNENDYQMALARIEELIESKPNTEEFNELEVLSLIVEDYEKRHYSIGSPTPIEAILFRMECMGLTKKDLAQYIGDVTRVTRILNGERALTVNMIKSLHRNLNIPLESLVGV